MATAVQTGQLGQKSDVAQECPELRALEHHIRDVPWAQLMEECVICCLAAACAALAPWEVLRAYRQVITLQAETAQCGAQCGLSIC